MLNSNNKRREHGDVYRDGMRASELSKSELKQLVSVAGDHSVSEQEWVRACELLGSYQATTSEQRMAKRKKNIVFVALCSVVLTAGFLFAAIYIGQTALNVEKISEPSFPSASKPAATDVAVDFGPYMANLQRSIKGRWSPPKGNVTRDAQVIFKIAEDGTLSHLKMSVPSGSVAMDNASLKAVRDAAPFNRLPDGSGSDVDIQFDFHYNVFQDSSSPVVTGNDDSSGSPVDVFTSSAAPQAAR